MPDIGSFDFSGYATKANVKCSDGRTITPEAFKHNHGHVVPLVWRHLREEPANVLGRAVLEHREDGVYVYASFNDTKTAQDAKTLVRHKDITHLSIYANSLIEKKLTVMHGEIREVSLVLSGANPGALIDYVAVEHADGTVINADDEAIIYMDSPIVVHEEDAEDGEGDTIESVFSGMSEKQKAAVYAIISQLMEDGEIAASDDTDEETSDEEDLEDEISHDEGETKLMKKNVFDGSVETIARPHLSHDDFAAIINSAESRRGSLKDAFMAHEAGKAFLEHAETYGIGSDRENLELLFPDARNATREPTFISRRMEWVSGVINGTKHVPFSRIKSLHADITADEARAKGYITGNEKTEEVFPVLRRITTPHTIYKKQKLDRNDIVDITDFDVVRWLKAEMRVMLDEEIGRAVLVSDGRDPITEVDDHIPTDNVRPIWGDSSVYVYYKQVASTQETDDLIDDIITAHTEYRGSGSPTLFCAPSFLTSMLLLKDEMGRRLYRTVQELASELRVKNIVEVPVMEGLQRTDTVLYNLRGIIVNLFDYTIGADRGGEINFFDDFDLDFNQYKYLLETRISGALTVPKAAIVLEQADA